MGDRHDQVERSPSLQLGDLMPGVRVETDGLLDDGVAAAAEASPIIGRWVERSDL
jgi:hypothetical protein